MTCGRTGIPRNNFALAIGAPSIDTKLMRRTGRRHLEFRLSITFAQFKYSRRLFSSATTVSMFTPGRAILEVA